MQKEKADLPNRQADLASAEGNLRRLAEELGWEVSDVKQLVSRIPSRAKVAAIHALLNSRGEKTSGIRNAKAAVEEAEDQIADLKQEIDRMAAPVDVSKLAAVVKAARESGDIALRINAAEGDAREANAAIRRGLKSLQPHVADEGALALVPVPARDTVHHYRDGVRGADQRMQANSP